MSFNLINGFNTASGLKKLDYDNDVDILMGGDGITSRITRQVSLLQHRASFEKKRKDFIDRLLNLTHQEIIEKIRQTQQDILDAVNSMDDIIKRTDDRIEVIQGRLQDMTRKHQDINDTIEARYFEKEEGGRYKSKGIRDTIIAFESRTGQTIPDDISPDMLILLLNSQKEFEATEMISALEKELVVMTEFRDRLQGQKETYEDKYEQIDQVFKAVDTDTSLNKEERRSKKIEVLKQASETTLDARMAAQVAEQDYVDLITHAREEKCKDNYETYIKHSHNETAKLNQKALENLKNIKPLLSADP